VVIIPNDAIKNILVMYFPPQLSLTRFMDELLGVMPIEE
jgi:hypothetical protein